MSEVMQWPANEIEQWPLDRIKPYPQNARSHSDEQIKKLAESMMLSGVTAPILVDEEGIILAGHGRYAAAKLNGFEQMPVAIARGWSEENKRAYRLWDNQSALLSAWDQPMLKQEFLSLKRDGYEVERLGFEPGQLSLLSIEEMAEPVANSGDQWQGMPSFEAMDGRKAVRVLRVLFADEGAVEEFKKLVGQDCHRAYIWFPEDKRLTRDDHQFTADK